MATLAAVDAARALAEIARAAERVEDKWRAIRESNADAAWEDFSFYKGNARWAAGARHDLEALDASRFASAETACDAAAALARNRGWDGDYDEPTAARGEVLAAIDGVRAKIGNHGGGGEAPRATGGAMSAAPVREGARGGPYRSPPRAGLARYAGNRPLGVVFTTLVIGAVFLTLFLWILPRQTLFARLVGLVVALPAALMYGLRVRTVIHDDRVEQGRALWGRTLRLADVRHVTDDGIDAMAVATRLSSALDSVVLTGADGTAVRLTADIPREVREDAIEVALDAAVRAAEEEIARGGRYQALNELVGLDAETLHGFHVGVTISRASLPLSEIVKVGLGGVVVGRDRATVCVGEGDRVLAALLRERGIGVR